MVNKSNIAAGGAVALAGLFAVGLSGCSFSMSTQSSVAADALQKDLTDRMTQAGMTAKSVTCKDDLVGEVGRTARCDVSFSDTNNIQAVFTATKVEGKTVDFEITPAMNKEQVEKAVAAIDSVPAATCASGLDGKVGETTKCEIDVDGKPSKRVVEVTKVDPAKLGIELSVYVLLPKQQVADVLMQKLGSDGNPVETVDCVDDVVSKVGSTVECAAVTGNDKKGYVVTVTEAEGDNVNFDYKAK